eukprot:scaffold4065_cov41-Attheya_sp.AAC.1
MTGLLARRRPPDVFSAQRPRDIHTGSLPAVYIWRELVVESMHHSDPILSAGLPLGPTWTPSDESQKPVEHVVTIMIPNVTTFAQLIWNLSNNMLSSRANDIPPVAREL